MSKVRPAGATVLVVEDDPNVREIVREFLRISGYAVLDSGEAEQGLRIAHDHAGPIDLLVTDVALRGMSGLELESHLARLRPATRVLFISGSPEGRSIQSEALPPGKAFLQKPFSLAGLMTSVRALLEPGLE